jgi:PTS system N-acetylgalactosamine-specific IIA component
MSSSVRAVVAGHGDAAAGLVSAAEAIAGVGAAFLALSNRGLGADGIAAALRDALDATGATVVFTDLPAGSCTMAARRLQRERPTLAVVTGANLPMLLAFALDGDASPAVAAARGREAIVVTGAA